MATKQAEVGTNPDSAAYVNHDLMAYMRAGYPLLYMVTAEEARAEAEIAQSAAALKNARAVYVWSCSEGLVNLAGGKEKMPEPAKMLVTIAAKPGPGIFILRDLHPFFKSPMVVRLLRDISRDFKQQQKMVIIISPVSKLPVELDRDAVVIDFDLPTKEQLGSFWDRLHNNENNSKLFKEYNYEIDEDERDRIIMAAMGLTTVEAENAFAKAIVVTLGAIKRGEENPPVVSELVMKEKALAVKRSGILEYFEPQESVKDIGGLDVLKLWMSKRGLAFSRKAREYGLPMPKGILLVGLPGCGKSLTAKAASNILGVPFVRFDISRVFGGIVGQSEQQMRGALQTIDRVGACVVWIDEAEKAFAGMGGSGSNDSGVTKRVFGNFLTWMQEKKGAGFVVMTVNNIDAIAKNAPEMIRKGRFDEIFFIGLPSMAEREIIWRIHIDKVKRDPGKFDLKKLAKASEKFSGAEIEQSVIDAMFSAFYDEKELTTKYILAAIKITNPLARTQEGPLNLMKKWADENAVNASTNGKDEGHAGRNLET